MWCVDNSNSIYRAGPSWDIWSVLHAESAGITHTFLLRGRLIGTGWSKMDSHTVVKVALSGQQKWSLHFSFKVILEYWLVSKNKRVLHTRLLNEVWLWNLKQSLLPVTLKRFKLIQKQKRNRSCLLVRGVIRSTHTYTRRKHFMTLFTIYHI